jgi:group II intron reverse transcriptase/maturase
MHHIHDEGRLRRAYEGLKRNASPGVDGETWGEYGKALEENLRDLSGRLRRGAYRAKPVRRAYITKEDGRRRPLGIPALEDKIVQRAASEVMNAIYETDFLGFSYGFRSGRSPHQALDALFEGIRRKRVNWILDADIRGFFEHLDHGWLVKFLEHRIADRRVVRLCQKWLKAGVLEAGKWRNQEEGTPQGGSASPLMANLYLHYVFDLWTHHWRRTSARGDVIVVRWADDFVVGFQYKSEAERFLAELKERFRKFGLELHPEKTRLLEFGRHAAKDRKRRGEGAPETFNFLGFTHQCGVTRERKKFTVLRRTMRKRMRIKLREIKTELRRRMHEAVPLTGKWLRIVMLGYYRYYGVPTNTMLWVFQREVGRAWYRTLRRRGQKGPITWERATRLMKRWFPRLAVYHGYPQWSKHVMT